MSDYEKVVVIKGVFDGSEAEKQAKDVASNISKEKVEYKLELNTNGLRDAVNDIKKYIEKIKLSFSDGFDFSNIDKSLSNIEKRFNNIIKITSSGNSFLKVDLNGMADLLNYTRNISDIFKKIKNESTGESFSQFDNLLEILDRIKISTDQIVAGFDFGKIGSVDKLTSDLDQLENKLKSIYDLPKRNKGLDELGKSLLSPANVTKAINGINKGSSLSRSALKDLYQYTKIGGNLKDLDLGNGKTYFDLLQKYISQSENDNVFEGLYDKKSGKEVVEELQNILKLQNEISGKSSELEKAKKRQSGLELGFSPEAIKEFTDAISKMSSAMNVSIGDGATLGIKPEDLQAIVNGIQSIVEAVDKITAKLDEGVNVSNVEHVNDIIKEISENAEKASTATSSLGEGTDKIEKKTEALKEQASVISEISEKAAGAENIVDFNPDKSKKKKKNDSNVEFSPITEEEENAIRQRIKLSEKYSEMLGDQLDITKQIRYVDGKVEESFRVVGKNKNAITFGKNSDGKDINYNPLISNSKSENSASVVERQKDEEEKAWTEHEKHKNDEVKKADKIFREEEKLWDQHDKAKRNEETSSDKIDKEISSYDQYLENEENQAAKQAEQDHKESVRVEQEKQKEVRSSYEERIKEEQNLRAEQEKSQKVAEDAYKKSQRQKQSKAELYEKSSDKDLKNVVSAYEKVFKLKDELKSAQNTGSDAEIKKAELLLDQAEQEKAIAVSNANNNPSLSTRRIKESIDQARELYDINKQIENEKKNTKSSYLPLDQAEKDAYEVNELISKTISEIDELKSSFGDNDSYEKIFSSLETNISNLNSKLESGKISLQEYKKQAEQAFNGFYNGANNADQKVQGNDVKIANDAMDKQIKAYQEILRLRHEQSILDPNTESAQISHYDDQINKQREIYRYNEQILKQHKNIISVQEQQNKLSEAKAEIDREIAANQERKANQEQNKSNANAKKNSDKQLNSAYDEASKINKALNETSELYEKISSSTGLGDQFDRAANDAEMLRQSLIAGTISAKEYVSELKKIDSSLTSDRYKQSEFKISDYDKYSKNFVDNGSNTEKFKNDIQSAISELQGLEKIANKIRNNEFISDDELKKISEATKAVENYYKVQNKNSNKVVNENTYEKQLANMKAFKEKLSETSEEGIRFRNEIDDLIKKQTAIGKSGSAEEIAKIGTAFQEARGRAEESGAAVKSFFDKFKASATAGAVKQLADMYLSLFDFIRYGKEAAKIVTEINSSQIELRKVSDAPESDLTAYWDQAAESAKKYGSAIDDVINSTADWSRWTLACLYREVYEQILSKRGNSRDGQSRG